MAQLPHLTVFLFAADRPTLNSHDNLGYSICNSATRETGHQICVQKSLVPVNEAY